MGLNLNVTIDSTSGFCFGVVYAIQMAEDYLDEYGQLYCLGDIVHNDEEVARLQKRGLEIIEHDQFNLLHDTRVLIRAHGEAPETYQTAMKNNIELVDASCPVVLKLQHRVKEAFDDKEAPIYIFGKHGHAEVKGLVGQTLGEAKVFMDYSEIENDELPAKISLFSQTTKDTRKLYDIKNKLEAKGVEVDFNDTICRQVSNRDRDLQKFVLDFEKIVFVSGKKSSNGMVLYNVCKEHNPNTFLISATNELDLNWFSQEDKVGICGATSTPQWLMEEVKLKLESY
jgi:4-hydroxy-3-methylbut-2-enyl diphosphate reductase